MLRWYPHLYIGDRALKRKGELIRDIEEQRFVPGAYLLTFPLNEANQLELLPAGNMARPVIYDRTPMIVGLAADRQEACELLEQIAKETNRARSDGDMKAYLRSRI